MPIYSAEVLKYILLVRFIALYCKFPLHCVTFLIRQPKRSGEYNGRTNVEIRKYQSANAAKA